MCKFRPLNPDEVELRVAQAKRTSNGKVWAQYLIYKDARVDQKILDETVGPLRWKKDYTFLDGKLYCTVSIWNEELQQWISKQDVGTESNAEKEKGQASDAFKRACVCFGIGRELYSAPDIKIWLNEGEYGEKDGKIFPYPNLFKVAVMDVADQKITRLTIVDEKVNIRFGWPAVEKETKAVTKKAEEEYRKRPTKNQIASMAKRIAKGEDIKDKIQVSFLMWREDWEELDKLVKQHQSK